MITFNADPLTEVWVIQNEDGTPLLALTSENDALEYVANQGGQAKVTGLKQTKVPIYENLQEVPGYIES